MPKPLNPQREWEQALVAAYYDYRWRQVLQPLHDEFQRWAAGELTHDDLNQAIHRTHRQNQQLYGLFTNKRDWLARVIQLDDDWFPQWVKDHPPPAAPAEPNSQR